VTVPGHAFRRTTTRSTRYPLLWVGRRALSIDALSGQAGVLTQAATVTVTDIPGNTVAVNNKQPPWSYVSGQLVTGLLLGTGTKRLEWPFRVVPQAMCGMIDFVENGGLAVVSGGVWSNGSATARLWLDSSGTQYRMNYSDGTTTRTCTMTGTAPTTGQRVRLRWILSATGTIQLGQSINGGAETLPAASAATTLPAAWTAALAYLNSVGAGNYGSNIYLGCVVMIGNQTAATLQAAIS
jgi:hypothetical protein